MKLYLVRHAEAVERTGNPREVERGARKGTAKFL